MKKILAFILMFGLSFAMVSCIGDEEEYDWKGNWNDPKDKNYKPEGYNPIEGMWKKKNSEAGLYFTEDFKVRDIAFYPDGTYKITTFRDTYIINNEAFRYQVYPETNRYILDGDVLKITANLFADKDWITYERFVPEEETEE